MSKKKITEKAAVAVLSAVTLGAVGMVTVGCNKKVGYIDAPKTLQAELGTYTVPEYEVVDKNGMILYGYNVKLKTAKSATGEKLEITGNAVTVEEAGIYDFVYTAGKGVADVTVKIDFADRTAPVINCDTGSIPDFFISGNSYRVPQYTISGDYEQSKCWSRVFYIDESGAETEVETEAKRFLVDKKTGEYAIRIHVEDAVGNVNDYEYKRKVDGPEHFVENKVMYFDEAFGARQASVYQPDMYTGGFVSKNTEGAHVYGEEQGAYKVSFDGESKTRDNEGIVVMNVPAVVDITDCIELEMYVYNDSKQDIMMGSMWWNDTKVKKGEWTRLTWKVDDEGWSNNKTADNKNMVSVVDISGMTIRFIFDYGKTIPNGDFYLSSMRVIPKTPTTITAGDNVTLDKNGESYFVGDTVYLTASEVSGETFDCFLVDGKPIGGDNFIARETAHTVTAKYIPTALTKENMTFGTVASYALSGSDAAVYKVGESDDWAISFDVYDLDNTKWNYFGVQVGGKDQVLGFELNKGGTSGKLSGYGGAWKWGDGVTLSQTTLDNLFAATEDKPATVKYLRSNNIVKVFVEYDGVSRFIGAVDVVNTLQCNDNSYGLGGRVEVTVGGNKLNNVPMHNIEYVATAQKTEFVHADYNATLTKDGPVEFENKQWRIGDTVTLTAPEESNGKLFLCFKVGTTRLSGNSFTITDAAMTVTAVYTDPCVVTLGEGLTVGGKNKVTVAEGSTIRVDYTSPAGKYFDGLIVGGNPVSGTTVTIDGNVTITASYKDRVQNDNVKLNDLSKAAETGGVVYHATKNEWRPKSVQYVDNFGYDGIDGKVDAGNSIKVTLSGDEQSFALNNGESDLSGYKKLYFYAYTEATTANLEAAGWWFGNTFLTPGKWTKVEFDRTMALTTIADKPIWENGLSQFAYRIHNGKAGDVVYVTAIYGVPYEDVEVTVDNAVKDYVSVSGTFKEEQTITLAVNGAPPSKAFKCFTVNGTPLASNVTTYKIKASDVENGVVIGAQFTDITDVTLSGGAATADGKTRYGRGVKVKLTHEAGTDGKVFDYYLLDGTTKIYDDTFTTSKANHTVSAVYANSASAITWGAGDPDRYTKDNVMGDTETSAWFNTKFDGQIFGSADFWSIKVNVKHTNTWNSVTFVTGSKESLLMRFETGKWFSFSKIDQTGNENAPTGTPLDYPWVNDIDNSRTPEQIAFRQMMNGKLAVGTEITVVRYGSTIKVFADNVQVLTITGIIDCTGDWFGISTGFDTTKPELKDIEFITGKDKVDAYLQTAGVIAVADGLDGKVVKYSSSDRTYDVPQFGVKSLSGDNISTPVSVTAKDAQGNALTVTNGKITLPDYAGSQAVTLTYSADGCPSATVKVNFQRTDGDVMMAASEFGAATVNANGNTVGYSTEQHHGDEAGSIKISNIASDETGVFLNKGEYKRFIEFYAYTTAENVKMGGWWCCDTALVANAWNRVIIDAKALNFDSHGGEPVLRLTKIKADEASIQGKTVYISSVKTFDESQQGDATRLNNIGTAIRCDGGGADLSVVDRSTITTALADAAVTESKVLKVTPKTGELSLRVWETFAGSLDAYEDVYFYVYTDDEPDTNTYQGGTWWCANTDLEKDKWTKITVTRNTNWAWNNGVQYNGVPTGISGNPYEKGAQEFVFRLMNGANKTFYVTSLYGTPKTNA